MFVCFIIWSPSEEIISTSEVFDSYEKALAWVAVEQIEIEEAYEPSGFSYSYIQNFDYLIAKVERSV